MATKDSHSKKTDDSSPPSLRGLYVIAAAATAAATLLVLALNISTPVAFVRGRWYSLEYMGPHDLAWELVQRTVFAAALILVVCVLNLAAMHRLFRPMAAFLNSMRAGGPEPPAEALDAARRRLLGLPYLSFPVNVAYWIATPLMVSLTIWLAGYLELGASLFFAIRTSIMGLIASAVVLFGFEAHCRRRLIPYFFPQGRLTSVGGVSRLTIDRRIRATFRLGALGPLVILLVTLYTLQQEVQREMLTAQEYGRGIIIFVLVLAALFSVAGGALLRLVAQSIQEPLADMLSVIKRVQAGDYQARIKVVSNDEIGVLGDAGNEMIRGLAEREKLRTAFGKYVTPEIRDEILSGRIPLEGERREATMLFSDLRGFTPFVENHPPEEVIAGMRAYFTAMHRAIRRHRGLVLQFVGDEIEAVFGVPVHFDGHQEAAVRAALDMRRALQEFNREREAAGKPAFAHGIGIHSGRVLAGNTGSEEQSAYALIGDTVNVASRIEGMTKEIGCDILVSRETVQALTGDYPLEEQPPRMVKGYSRPVVVYRLG